MERRQRLLASTTAALALLVVVASSCLCMPITASLHTQGAAAITRSVPHPRSSPCEELCNVLSRFTQRDGEGNAKDTSTASAAAVTAFVAEEREDEEWAFTDGDELTLDIPHNYFTMDEESDREDANDAVKPAKVWTQGRQPSATARADMVTRMGKEQDGAHHKVQRPSRAPTRLEDYDLLVLGSHGEHGSVLRHQHHKTQHHPHQRHRQGRLVDTAWSPKGPVHTTTTVTAPTITSSLVYSCECGSQVISILPSREYPLSVRLDERPSRFAHDDNKDGDDADAMDGGMQQDTMDGFPRHHSHRHPHRRHHPEHPGPRHMVREHHYYGKRATRDSEDAMVYDGHGEHIRVVSAWAGNFPNHMDNAKVKFTMITAFGVSVFCIFAVFL